MLSGVDAHSDAGVSDCQHDVPSRHDRRMLAGVCLVELDVPGLDADRAALWHRVASVHHQVDEDLLDLTRISDDVAARRTTRCDDDIFADQAAKHRLDRRHDAVHVQHSWLQNLLPAECQQLLREGGSPLRCASYLLDVLAARIRGVEPVHDDFSVEPDHRQEIVEIVRDSSRQPADGIHLLRLAELLFEVASLGKIDRDANVSDHCPPLIANRRRGEKRRESLS